MAQELPLSAGILGVTVAAHVQPDAQVHLMCAVPPAIAFEHVPWCPWSCEELLSIAGGVGVPPAGPGLGVTPAADRVDRYRVDLG